MTCRRRLIWEQKLDEDWEFQVDNAFAGSLFSRIKKSATLSLPSPRDSSNLCDDCQDLDFWSNAFNVVYEIPDLEKKAGDCELCNLFWETCKAWNGDKFPTVQFERVDSFLKMNGGGPPVLSIVRGPDLQTRVDIQIGFPELPPAGSPTHFEVIRQWLKLCDDKNKHPRCQSTSPGKSSATKRLPTRLIDVGNEGEATVRLVETKATEVGDYIALSHPWGDPPHFCTFKSNLPAHKSGIDIGELPATFRDAVLTTRALGVQYLWIDSLCIVQKSDDDDGDFDIESRRMESVFSSAYCVIAASRASNHTSGFLQPQRQRRYVALRRGSEEPFYICENLDDFKSHVLEGPMSQRGWVFQEHALARRTIFFTEHQTYWECGEGVRCETLTRMNNNLAAFLGDPNFPQIVMSAKRGEKIIRFQNLYKQYSRLDFSRDYDRPIAINGLEKRLLEAFGNEGGFGIIDEGDRDGRRTGLLRRSLLWHRWTGDEARPAGEATLSRIKFPRERAAVPSWSWMAYMGEIDYLPLDFNGVEWTEVRSPWSGSRSQRARTADRSGNIALTAVARDVDASAAGEGEGRLILDTPGGSEKHVFKAVVLARKGKNPREPTGPRRHYILVITPTNQLDRDGNKVYERVGVGYLPGRCLSADGPTVRIY